MPSRRTAVVETSPSRVLCNFTTKPGIFYKQIETFLAPAPELELFRVASAILKHL